MIKLLYRSWKDTGTLKNLIGLIFIFFTTALLLLASSQFLGNLIQAVLENHADLIINSFIIYIVLELLILVLNYLGSHYKLVTVENMKRIFKKLTLSHLIDAPYSFSQKQEKGDIIGRLEDDVSSIVTASSMGADIIKAIILCLVFSLCLMYYNFYLFLLFIIPIVLNALIQMTISDTIMNFIVPWKEAQGSRNSLFQEILSNQSTIRIYQLEDQANNWIDEASRLTQSRGFIGLSKLNIIQTTLSLISFLPIVLVLIGGAYLVSNNNINIAQLTSSLMIANLANDEFSVILVGFINIPHLMSSAQRIFPLWDSGYEEFGDELGFDKTEQVIELNDVSFSYNQNKDVLKNINLKIKRGESIGIVGTSGSGKSTLFKLLLGLYSPTAGEVKVNALSVQRWEKDALRNQFAVVSQKHSLFSDSIAQNIKYGNDDLSHGEISSILKSVKLNKDPDMQIGESGQFLSGGERQRLSIARALVKDADILLLDEASSALDLETETQVMSLIAGTHNHSTQLIVAHRLSTVVSCDRILVLNQGKIVEMGDHKTLMRKKGVYYNLFNLQKGEGHEKE